MEMLKKHPIMTVMMILIGIKLLITSDLLTAIAYIVSMSFLYAFSNLGLVIKKDREEKEGK